MTWRHSSWSPYRHFSAARAGEADQAQGQPGSEKWVTVSDTYERLEEWLHDERSGRDREGGAPDGAGVPVQRDAGGSRRGDADVGVGGEGLELGLVVQAPAGEWGTGRLAAADDPLLLGFGQLVPGGVDVDIA